MKTQTFIAGADGTISALIKANVLGAGFVFIRQLFKNKDVKLNGVRVNRDVPVRAGDTVQIYYAEQALPVWRPYRLLWEDENVAVVFKERGIETSSPTNANTLERLLGLTAVHRLDVNTEGVVVFAKNQAVATELELAFATGRVEKTYQALCFGELQKSPVTLAGYLTKDKVSGFVTVSKEKSPGALPIKTVVSALGKRGDYALLEIKPLTGRTHQIRAHLASIGLYIVGDGKYGNAKLNRLYRQDQQCLCATKIKFAFPAGSLLYYLDGKEFSASPSFC